MSRNFPKGHKDLGVRNATGFNLFLNHLFPQPFIFFGVGRHRNCLSDQSRGGQEFRSGHKKLLKKTEKEFKIDLAKEQDKDEIFNDQKENELKEIEPDSATKKQNNVMPDAKPQKETGNTKVVLETKPQKNLSVEDIELGIMLNEMALGCDKSTFIDVVSYYDGKGPALFRLCK